MIPLTAYSATAYLYEAIYMPLTVPVKAPHGPKSAGKCTEENHGRRTSVSRGAGFQHRVILEIISLHL